MSSNAENLDTYLHMLKNCDPNLIKEAIISRNGLVYSLHEALIFWSTENLTAYLQCLKLVRLKL